MVSDCTTDFALIGHLENWGKIANVVRHLRGAEDGELSLQHLRDIFSWIPPRTVMRLTVRSYPAGEQVHGVYIDTFISPDELRPKYWKKNVLKVQQAAHCAIREGARMIALGGFSSIVLEGRVDILPAYTHGAFTTGNTLTAAYIVKGIEAAMQVHGKLLRHSRLLVIGSTGDIGSGCTAYLAPKVQELLLCARHERRLKIQQNQLRCRGIATRITTNVEEVLPHADVIICAASVAMPTFSFSNCKPDALICDAGYPKNGCLSPGDHTEQRIFFGGMGRALGGFASESKLLDAFYQFPLAHIAHGCMLEGMLLALEKRHEPYSRGRGDITTEKIEAIWELAQKHGFVLAPFFNHNGLWANQPT